MPFCDAELQSGVAGDLKDGGRRHLQSHDYHELSAAFAATYGGDECRDDCGYVYPADMDGVDGFACPECGFDHVHAFARRYLHWQIERA